MPHAARAPAAMLLPMPRSELMSQVLCQQLPMFESLGSMPVIVVSNRPGVLHALPQHHGTTKG